MPDPCEIIRENAGRLLGEMLAPSRLAAWTPPAVEEAAGLFPQYEVLGLLGRGGMGAVYQARQVALDRCVAIKLLPLEVSADQEFAERFRREARAMAKLSHPHIVHVYEFGTTGAGHLFFVMEFIEGANLADLVQGAALPAARALELASQVCRALAYAHGKGIIHCDIKPANVMVSLEGIAKVADFGVARLAGVVNPAGYTTTNVVMGTPDYMAPEQKRGLAVDQRADIYSVGVMLYEMLCGETPQGAFEPPSQRASCDPRIDPIVLKAMQPDPEKRYQATDELRRDLEAAFTVALAESVPPAVASTPTPAARKKSRLLRYAGLTGFIAALAGGASLLHQPKPPTISAPAPASSPARRLPGAMPAAGQTHRGKWEPSAGGWKPLYGEAEWETTVPGKREIENGWVHLQNYGLGKQQPSADGAIRALLRYQARPAGRESGAVELRKLSGVPGYSLQLYQDRIALFAGTGKALSSYALPRPLHPGETIRLELRAVGDHLVGLADGAVAIDLHDSLITRVGNWGIGATDGWFRDIEVEPFSATNAEETLGGRSPAPMLAASTPAPPLPEVWEPSAGGWKPFWSDEAWTTSVPGLREYQDGWLHLMKVGIKAPQPSPDGAIRARLQFREGLMGSGVWVRNFGRPRELSSPSSATSGSEPGFALIMSPQGRELYLVRKVGNEIVRHYILPRALQPGDSIGLELRAIGDHLVGLADGVVVIDFHASSVPESGWSGLWGLCGTNGWFQEAEVQPYPAAK